MPFIPITLDQLAAGMRFCVACSLLCILPNEPDFVVRCEKCYVGKRAAWHCRCCGAKIDATRVNVAKKYGREALDCYNCKNGKEIGRKTLMKSLSSN